ncbi:MAG: hypothetical protein FGM24_08580 [Candidatus Kapabacteria bacterium]|nr:hypothetical protein [Candidatus Kapabacteria bacterium]
MIRLAIIATVLIPLFGCAESNAPTDTFDRQAMLQDLAMQAIIPAYMSMQTDAGAMIAAIDALTLAPSEVTLRAAREAWLSTALSWQRAQLFDFGPADAITGTLGQSVNTFPTSTAKVEAAIAAGDTSLQNFDRDARGLPALDYLLFDGSAAKVVAKLSTSPMRRAYLRAVTRDIAAHVQRVYNAWNTTYYADFVGRNGTDAGSGATQVFNALNRGFELLKNFKIGIPAGLQAGQTAAAPMSVEAPYSGLSWRLALEHQQAVRDLWTGRVDDSMDYRSFAMYILARGGTDLDRSTTQQFDAIEQASAAIPEDADLGALCAAQDPRIRSYYVELQKLTRFIKSETSSLLGISITYASGDGD